MVMLKNTRKNRSIVRRQEWLRRLAVVFNQAYKTSKGEGQQRLEYACKQCDDVIAQSLSKAPQEKAFFNLVVQDFQKYLSNIARNENKFAQVAAEQEVREAVPGEIGTVNV